MMDNQITCLIVDDEEQLRSALRRVLELAGYRCLEASSGIEAIEVLEQEPDIPLIFSDIHMPEMDGLTLLKNIRQRWPDSAVVMASAISEVEVAVSCLKLGALDYIVKPFQIHEVTARADQALDKRRLILENRRYQFHLAELVQQQASRIEELFLEGVQALVEALEAKDPYTRGHSTRVSAYAAKTARSLGMSEKDIRLVELGAELHDVGKIGVRESALLKPSTLEPHEYDHLMKHTTIGATILSPLLKNAPEVLGIVRWHHERLDGSGRPDGLKGDSIPRHAKVVSVADAFDAMTSARPYRPALTAQAAIVELGECTGTQFDPQAVAGFLDAHPDVASLPIATPRKTRRSLPAGVAAGDGASVPT
jgi:putative nucleotidyltransferase with HDIG domain